jgi:hypothetical protein
MDRVNNSSWCCDELENYLEELRMKLAWYKDNNRDNSCEGEIKILEQVIEKMEEVFYCKE